MSGSSPIRKFRLRSGCIFAASLVLSGCASEKPRTVPVAAETGNDAATSEGNTKSSIQAELEATQMVNQINEGSFKPYELSTSASDETINETSHPAALGADIGALPPSDGTLRR